MVTLQLLLLFIIISMEVTVQLLKKKAEVLLVNLRKEKAKVAKKRQRGRLIRGKVTIIIIQNNLTVIFYFYIL